MKLNITESAMKQLIDSGIKQMKVFISGFGWAGPTFGMVQGEPEDEDFIEEVNGVKFIIGKETSETVSILNIDYSNSWLRKGFSVYAGGQRGRC